MECNRCGSAVGNQEEYCSACGKELDFPDEKPSGKSTADNSTTPNSSATQDGDSDQQELDEIVDDVRTAFEPAVDSLSEKITDHVSIRAGVRSGVKTYLLGLFVTSLIFVGCVIIGQENSSTAVSLGPNSEYGFIDLLMQSGVTFYSAHNSVTGYSGLPEGLESFPANYILALTDFLANAIDINNVAWTAATFNLKLLFLLIPLGIFISAFRFANGQDEDDGPMVSVARGASLTAGYLPLAIIGSFVFAFSANEFTATPKLGSALLMVGLVYPISFGGLGGAAASLVPRLNYSLKSSITYGFLAGVLSIVGTLSLSFIAIETTSSDVVELLQTGLILYAYSTNYTLPGDLSYTLPKFLFGFVIVGSTGLAGFVASRNYQDSLRKSLGSGISVSLGFSIALLIALFIMLLPLQISPAVTINDDLILQPVKIWLYGGIIFPSFIGGLTAAIQYYRHQT